MIKKVLSYDTECTGLYKRDRNSFMFAYSICDRKGNSQVFRMDKSAVRKAEADLMLNKITREDHILIMHNAKFDIGFTEEYLQRPLRWIPVHDTSLMSRLIRNDHYSHRLKDLTRDYASYPTDDEKEVKSATKGGASWSTVNEELMTKYQHRDAIRTILLYEFFYPKITCSPKLTEIYRNELSLIPISMEMEDAGVHIDLKKCAALLAKVRKDVEAVRENMFSFVGKRFNPGSPGFIRHYLFNVLKLPILDRTPTGEPSTKKEFLLQLHAQTKHPFLVLLQKYRSWSHGSTIIEGYLERAEDNGMIHPTINTCEAITGRLSCSNPNLMNVERSDILNNPYPVAARTVFTPREGCVNFHIDYSGIEMRLLVHYAREEELVEILKEGGDVHLPATLLFFGDRYRIADKKTKKTLRSAAKNCNFAIPYGAGPDKLISGLQVDKFTSHSLYAEYYRRFPKLSRLNRTFAKMVKECGYVETELGRILYISPSKGYVALNHLIQATACEILKRGIERVHHVLVKKTNNEVRLLLPIHDEIVIECPKKYLKDIRPVFKQVRQVMIDFDCFTVPLEVECSLVKEAWEEKEDFPFEKK